MNRSLCLSFLFTATCARAELFGWGRNDVGQVGDGSAVQRNLPVMAHPSTATVCPTC